MAEKRKRKVDRKPDDSGRNPPEDLEDDPSAPFGPDLLGRMREISVSGLDPSSVLDLLARLISEAPSASKAAMDKIKMIDSLVKTARAMMETKLKHDDAAAIMKRLDEIETQMDKMEAKSATRNERLREVREDRKDHGRLAQR